MIEYANSKSEDINLKSYLLRQKGKLKEIYGLIEELSESDREIKVIKIKKSNESKTSNSKLFEGRNIIKKVKTHCLKVFYRALKECTDSRETVISTFRLKIHEKRIIYNMFKSDISKNRNKILLNLRMKKIMKMFSNININDPSKIKPLKKIIFNFLMNSKWIDIITYVKRGSKEILKILNGKACKLPEITIQEINQYLEYIRLGSNKFKVRVNLDKGYISFFENILNELKNAESEPDEKIEINKYLKEYKCL